MASMGQPSHGRKRPAEQEHLGERADQQAEVQRDHPREVPPAVLDPATREGPPRVARRHDDLGQPLAAGQQDEDQVVDHAGQSSSTNSALTPGGRRRTAAPNSRAPGRSRPRAREARMPTTGCRPAQATRNSGASAPSGKRSASAKASRIRGPPGWANQASMSAWSRPLSARKLATLVREIPRDDIPHGGRQHDLETGLPDVEPDDALAIGIDGAAGVHDGRTRFGRASPTSTTAACPIPKQPARDEVGHRFVIALQL